MKKTLKKSKRKKKVNLRKDLEALQKRLTIKIYGNDCFTCEAKNLQKSNCQLGHVPWPRTMLATPCKYDYHYTRIQCFKCNIWGGGMGGAAAVKMLKQGINLDDMWASNLAYRNETYGNRWFKTKIAEYEKELEG